MSTTFPFPSSPHWVPTTTMLGIKPLRMLQHSVDLRRALSAARHVDHQELARRHARTTHDERATDAQRPRGPKGVLESPRADVTCHGAAGEAHARRSSN